MKLLLQTFSNLQERIRTNSIQDSLAPLNNFLLKAASQISSAFNRLLKWIMMVVAWSVERVKSFDPELAWARSRDQVLVFHRKLRTIGFSESLDDYEKRKLSIFNQLNFLQLVSGLIVPIACIFSVPAIPNSVKLLSLAPAFVSLLVLFLNSKQRYDGALLAYFILHPFFSCLIYMGGLHLGVELFFILYGVLSVFFIQQISHMLFSIGLSMVSYYILAVVLERHLYHLENINYFFYLFNEFLAIALIYVGLYLVKRENTGYQFGILASNRRLHAKNLEVERQKREIAGKARQLEIQTAQLKELNALKTKLFSVISHDLKTPIYALRNLFQTVQKQNIPARDIKAMIPEVVNDLHYTTSLMENLLHWAKSQMQEQRLHPQHLDLATMIGDVSQLLRLQAEAKKIHLKCQPEDSVIAWADRDMVHLVLRNLLSNAIKFTPENGTVILGASQGNGCVEVFVEDSGIGISDEALRKINGNEFYSTTGTANETGTGLGLMLCKEFLMRNGGHMHVESMPGKGSVFSFTLPVK